MNRFVSLIVLLSYVAILATAQQCYYPNGAIPTDYTYRPCSGSRYTSCCIPSAGDICLSNGLCWWPSGQFPYRAACTDREWISDACPRFCMGVNPTTWERLYVCGGNKYCCGNGCCSDSANTFFIAPGSVINSFGQSGYSIPAELTAVSSPTLSSSLTGATTGSTATPTSTSSSSNTSKNVAVGVGVGVGVGLFLAIILAFFCYRYFLRKPSPSIAPFPQQSQQSQLQPQTPNLQYAPTPQPQVQTTYPPPLQPSYSPPPQQHQQQISMYPPWPTHSPPYHYHIEQKPAVVDKPILEQVPFEADSTPSQGPVGGATELDATLASGRK